MRDGRAGFVACACAALAIAAAGMAMAALELQYSGKPPGWRDSGRPPGWRDEGFDQALGRGADRPSPRWLHLRGVPALVQDAQRATLHTLTHGDPAASMAWWTPLP